MGSCLGKSGQCVGDTADDTLVWEQVTVSKAMVGARGPDGIKGGNDKWGRCLWWGDATEGGPRGEGADEYKWGNGEVQVSTASGV